MRPVRARKLGCSQIPRAPKGRSKVTNGRQLFIDGDARLKVSRRSCDVLASTATDLGGADRLSQPARSPRKRTGRARESEDTVENPESYARCNHGKGVNAALGDGRTLVHLPRTGPPKFASVCSPAIARAAQNPAAKNSARNAESPRVFRRFPERKAADLFSIIFRHYALNTSIGSWPDKSSRRERGNESYGSRTLHLVAGLESSDSNQDRLELAAEGTAARQRGPNSISSSARVLTSSPLLSVHRRSALFRPLIVTWAL